VVAEVVEITPVVAVVAVEWCWAQVLLFLQAFTLYRLVLVVLRDRVLVQLVFQEHLVAFQGLALPPSLHWGVELEPAETVEGADKREVQEVVVLEIVVLRTRAAEVEPAALNLARILEFLESHSLVIQAARDSAVPLDLLVEVEEEPGQQDHLTPELQGELVVQEDAVLSQALRSTTVVEAAVTALIPQQAVFNPPELADLLATLRAGLAQERVVAAVGI
jgi:hypothetical protein